MPTGEFLLLPLVISNRTPILTGLVLMLSTRSQRWASVLVVTALCSAFDVAVLAQSEPVGRGQAADVSGSLPVEHSAAETDRTEEAAGPSERVIYIPFDKLEAALEKLKGSVVIPYEEYVELWKRAVAGEKPTDPPVQAMLTSAAYQVHVSDDLARITAEFTVNVLERPWGEIPLKFGEAAVGAVRGTGGDVLLRGAGQGRYVLLVKEPGVQKVRLELTTRVVTTPEGQQFEFDCPSTAITTIDVTVPQSGQKVEVRPRLLQQPVSGGEGLTRVQANLGATEHIAVSWRPDEGLKPEMELLASVTSHQRIDLADGLMHTDAWLHYDVLRGTLQQVRIAVAADQRVLDVTASRKLQGWQLDEADGHQVLTVSLVTAVEDTVRIEVHTERRLDGNRITVAGIGESGTIHGIRALDVVRESGQLVLSHAGDLSVVVAEQTGLTRMDPEEAADEIRQPGAAAYKFYTPQFALSVTVSPIEPRISVDQLVREILGEDELTVATELSYVIDRAGVFELSLGVPDGLTIDDVSGEAVREFRAEEGQLTIILRERTLGEVRITVSGHQSLAEDVSTLTLPVLQPRPVDRESGRIELYAPPAIEIATIDSELKSVLSAAANAAQAIGPARLASAWRFTRRPVVVPVHLTRKPTRLSAEVTTDIDVQPARTRVTTLVSFLVEYAGLDTFRFQVPEGAMPTLQIEAVRAEPASAAIRQTVAAEPSEGWVMHTVTMQRAVLGRQQFRIRHDLDPGQPVAAAAVTSDTPPAAPAGTDGGTPATTAADSAAAPGSSPGPAPTPDTIPAPTPGGAGGEAAPAATAPPSTGATPGEAAAPAESAPGQAPADAARTEAAPSDDTAAPARVAVILVRPAGVAASDSTPETVLSGVTGEVRVTQETSLTIRAEANGADIEPIDVRELSRLPAEGALAFRYRKHPSDETIAVSIEQSRFAVQEVLGTVITRGLVEVVLGEDPTATYRCRYRIRSTERQRLRLELPRGPEVLSVLVNDTAVRLEPDRSSGSENGLWEPYYVNVGRSGASDEPFLLTVQFLWGVNPPPFDRGFMRGRMELPLPRVGTEDDSAVQQLRVVAWVPREYALLGDPQHFTLEGYTPVWNGLWGRATRVFPEDDAETWLGQSTATTTEFPTTGRVAYRYTSLGGATVIKLLWWDTVLVTVVVSLAIALIALLLLQTAWENKLGILLLLALAAALTGLKSLHVLAHGLAAARFGMVFLLGLWTVHALFGKRTATPDHTPIAPEAHVTSGTPPYAAAVPPPGVFDQFLGTEPRDDGFR
jgi:hypothetical protein